MSVTTARPEASAARELGPGGTPPSRPSILVIAPTPFFADRGCHVRIYEETRLLQHLGYHVEICTYHHGRELPGVFTRRTPNFPWYKKLGPGPSLHKFYVDIFLLFRCLAVAREIRPAVIHAHLHEGAFFGAIVSRLLRIPCVADLQGSLTGELADYGFGGKNRLLYGILRTVENWINRSVDHIVVSSAAFREDLIQRFKIPEDRVTEVRDGVGESFFSTPPPGAREQLGIAAKNKVVAFVGVLTRLQGREILLDVIPQVLDARDDVTFVVVGFPGEADCARRLDHRGYRERVHFVGRVDYLRIAEILGESDLAISPKISETEGNGKLFNYMAAGLPTVVFDNPVNREILGDDGIYVKDREANAFARGILAALEDEAGSAEIGR
ncbi:MAG: glycosyltransferase family 4 protein, partial [Gemmatimonadetes bacterium]|nr:glycosyltransferase family 4 protein [Gemmatimonadota bacterium]